MSSKMGGTQRNRTQIPGQDQRNRKKFHRPGVVSGPKPLNPDMTDNEMKDYWNNRKANELSEIEQLQAQNAAQMRRLMGTEVVIERVLGILDTDPWDDLGNWPADAAVYKGMKLSRTKM